MVPWDPLGYLGSLSRDPLGRIFSKCVFLSLLNPLGLPIPSNAMEASKKLKKFPRGCEYISYWNNIESRFDVSHSRSQECISQKISNLNLVFYKVNKLWYLVWLFLCLKCGTSISTVGTLRWTRYLLSLSAKFRSGFSWRLFWVSARSETDKNSRLNTHV